MKIISGGQTGVDRAALDVALEMNVEHGGWCPKGRLAEDGCIKNRYCLRETKTSDYETRTEKNVTSSDGTLVISRQKPNGGTLLTIIYSAQHGKPVLLVSPKSAQSTAGIKKTIDWIKLNNIKVLNVAGPRASKDPGIYEIAFHFLKNVIKHLPQTLF